MDLIKILLVDDQQTVLMFESHLLRSICGEFKTARNGEEAIESLREFHADLILLDINMPVLNGIDTCRRIKTNQQTKHIPVIMVTTKGQQEKMEEARVAGCDDYVTKPIDPVDLFKKIERLVRK